MFLLLCGCGVGFSVEFEHVEKLPKLADKIDETKVVHHTIEDSIEGWADAIGKLIEKADASAAIEDVTSVIRQALENLPHRTAPELVGKDLDGIRATLKQEVHAALADMEREFTKRLNQMGSEE
jgi:hypothetical protein